MSYVLHYAPGSASLAVHWMLVELGVGFELALVDLDAGDQTSPAYLAINPSGRVPTLVIDGRPYSESAALLMLLAERHPEARLAPPVGAPGRAGWMTNMIYLANTLLPAFRDWFYAAKDGDAAGVDAVTAMARARIERAWETLDAQLGDGRTHLLGETLTTVDLLATMLMRWSRRMPAPATAWPNLNRYIVRMRAMRSFNQTCDREGLTEWRNP